MDLFQMDKVQVRVKELSRASLVFDLSINLVAGDQELTGYCDFNTDLFDCRHNPALARSLPDAARCRRCGAGHFGQGPPTFDSSRAAGPAPGLQSAGDARPPPAAFSWRTDVARVVRESSRRHSRSRRGGVW